MNQGSDQILENTKQFAAAVRDLGKVIPMTVSNVEDLKQLIRSSGAVGAAYIAAVGAAGRKEYLLRIRNCLTEARNTHYWLGLIDTQGAPELEKRRSQLMQIAEDLAQLFMQVIQSANK
ncbi:MAG: four helix bundle protein [Bacteroidota bacterium]